MLFICSRAATFSVEWSSKSHFLKDITSNGQPVRSRGAYVTSLSHDGHLLAIGVNQRGSHSNRIVFMSTMTELLVVADLYGSGAREPVLKNTRSSVFPPYLMLLCLKRQCFVSCIYEITIKFVNHFNV